MNGNEQRCMDVKHAAERSIVAVHGVNHKLKQLIMSQIMLTEKSVFMKRVYKNDGHSK